MEFRFHFLLHPGRHHGLRYPVGDGGNAENPGSRAMRFRDFHRFHRRREVAPRRHPVPDPCRDCFFRSASKSSIDCPSAPGAPLLAFTFRYASHTSCFDMLERLACDLCSPTRFLPGLAWLT